MASVAEGFAADPQEAMRQIAAAIEERTAAAMEQLVAGEGFSELFVRVTENLFALSRIRDSIWDLTLRNLRLAGRRDIERLAHQLMRTEDKLELLLQAVERLEATSVPR
jgi:hypothetical protein